MKIKRSSAFQKGSALQQASLAAAISQSEVQVGSCGHSLTGRPLWMVGKYDICFDCYEERQREIEKSLPEDAQYDPMDEPEDGAESGWEEALSD